MVCVLWWWTISNIKIYVFLLVFILEWSEWQSSGSWRKSMHNKSLWYVLWYVVNWFGMFVASFWTFAYHGIVLCLFFKLFNKYLPLPINRLKGYFSFLIWRWSCNLLNLLIWIGFLNNKLLPMWNYLLLIRYQHGIWRDGVCKVLFLKVAKWGRTLRFFSLFLII